MTELVVAIGLIGGIVAARKTGFRRRLAGSVPICESFVSDRTLASNDRNWPSKMPAGRLDNRSLGNTGCRADHSRRR
jgi:hypothetical protein